MSLVCTWGNLDRFKSSEKAWFSSTFLQDCDQNSENDGLAFSPNSKPILEMRERKLTSVVCRNQNDRAIQLLKGTLCTVPLFLKYEDWDPEKQ